MSDGVYRVIEDENGSPVGLEPVDQYADCLDRHKGGCEGACEPRMPLTASGKSFIRCDAHWLARLDEQERISEAYPDSPCPPDWFDPSAAGERWDEDE